MSFGPCTIRSAREKLDHGFSAITAATVEILEGISEMKRADWERDGATSISNWLAMRYRIAWGTALEWVRVARKLGELPEIFRAFSEGALSWDQLRPLVRFATRDTDAAWAEREPPGWSLRRFGRRSSASSAAVVKRPSGTTRCEMFR